MSIELILNQLDKVRPRGGDKWMACCPHHDDKNPSLGLALLSDGRILVKCMAGCDTNDVLAAIGLSMDDLFPDKGLANHMRGWNQMVNKKGADVTDEAILEIADARRSRGERLTAGELEIEKQAFIRVKKRGAA